MRSVWNRVPGRGGWALRGSLSTMIDPLVALLVGAFGAAALTVGGGFLGAFLQHRREHERWIREQRFDAYRDFLSGAERMTTWVATSSTQEVLRDTQRAIAAVRLLGPDDVIEAAIEHGMAAGELGKAAANSALGSPVHDKASTTYWATKDVFVAAARRELGIAV